jgi:hypothetical protein
MKHKLDYSYITLFFSMKINQNILEEVLFEGILHFFVYFKGRGSE